MARPERNNVDYFPFYCDDGKKMFYLEEKYGNDGFATFVKILRELAKTDYHYLDLSKNITFMFLSAKCKVSKEILESIINDLVDLEKFDRDLWEQNKIIWCQDFIDSIADAYKKRNNKCITYDSLLDLLEGLGTRKQSKSKSKGSNNTQSKVKYSKEDKSKGKETALWRTDFEIYKKELIAAYEEIIKDKEFIKEIEYFYPKSDPIKSIQLSIKNFWMTKEGYQNKLKSKSETIDWKATLRKTVKINLVNKEY